MTGETDQLISSNHSRCPPPPLQPIQPPNMSAGQNPYEILFLFSTKNSGHLKAQGKISFAGKLFDTYDSWVDRKRGESESLSNRISSDLKLAVFDAFWDVSSWWIFERSLKIFELSNVSDVFLSRLRTALKRPKEFRRACEAILLLNLQESFTIHETIVPIILNKEVFFLKDLFLDKSKALQLSTVQWLDSVYGMSGHCLQNEITRECPLALSKPFNVNELSSVAVERLVKKIVTKYELDPSIAPKVFRVKKVAAFRHLVKEKKSMRVENWRDLVRESISQHSELGQHLLNFLTDGRTVDYDPEEAALWKKSLDLTTDTLPVDVQEDINQYLMNLRIDCDEIEEPSDSRPDETFLKLDPSCIIFLVDSRQKFYEFLEEIRTEYVIGMDCEFTPKLMGKSPASLMQLATKSKIFLIPMEIFTENLTSSEVENFVMSLFIRGNHVILGYGLNSDFQALASTHLAFRELTLRSEIILDLESLTKLIMMGTKKILHLPNPSHYRGLSGLAEKLLGKPLDKQDQVSLWSKRPLSETQMKYAALDAKVLVMIYDAIWRLAEEAGVSGEVAKVEQMLKKNRNKAIQEAKKRQVPSKNLEQAQFVSAEPLKLCDIPLACDSMLQGLSTRLSYEGFDSVAIEPFETIETCGELASLQDRKILTRGMKRYAILASYVRPGWCLALRSDLIDDQVSEVYKHFNVQRGVGFTRCESCNSDQYIKIPTTVGLKIANNQSYENEDREEHHFDNFLDDDSDDSDELYIPVSREVEKYKVGDIEIDVSTGSSTSGVNFNFVAVPRQIFMDRDEVFGCVSCGEISWQKY